MIFPFILTIYGIAKINNKSPQDREAGKTALIAAGIWGTLSLAVWAYMFSKAQQATTAAINADREGAAALPPAGMTRSDKVMLLLGLPPSVAPK